MRVDQPPTQRVPEPSAFGVGEERLRYIGDDRGELPDTLS
jgi:hypothetical protein